MSIIPGKAVAASVSGMVVAIAALPGVAHAATSEEARYTHPSCESSTSCGVIVMGNGGAYTLDWVELDAHSSQPSNAPDTCSDIDQKLTRDVPSGNYDTFVVPASCSYKLKLKILSGNSKDQNLFLTPGCQIIAKVAGTTSSNSWKSLEISALSSQVPTNSDKKPIDGLGQKCGKLSGAYPD